MPLPGKLSRARFAFDWRKQFALWLGPETAEAAHDEGFRHGESCSMCAEALLEESFGKDLEFTEAVMWQYWGMGNRW